MIRSLVRILVAIPSVANACADTLPPALMNVNSLYCAPLVLQIKARERGSLAVRVVNFWSTRSILSHIVFPLEVSQSIALNLGLTNKQYRIWTEMEMVGVSVPLNCREYVNTVQPPRSCANVGIGASGRCSWIGMNTKRLTSSSVRFRTVTMRGASSVSSQSTWMVQSTRVMALWN